ncbi:MAG TPA: SH3 domain-containing protein, partial [Microlunatus sp.]|nr:SH3 domain-containing protein [Microlunatus sp.]
VTVIDEAEKLKVTEIVKKGYRQVVVKGKARWVTDDYLSKKKPSAESSAGISGDSCGTSSGIESGLVANGKKAYRAMCAAFPEVSSFGGRRGSNDFHGSGQAIDAMISDSGAGWRLANWVRDHASDLGVSEVIYSQKIWTVQRSGEGWRGMSDRGSATANHYDHVHVSVY